MLETSRGELYLSSHEEKALRHFTTDGVISVLIGASTCRSLLASGYIQRADSNCYTVTDEGFAVLRRLDALDTLILRQLEKGEAFPFIWDRNVVAHRLMEMYHRRLTSVDGPKETSFWQITEQGLTYLKGKPETTTEIVAYAFGWGPLRYDREAVL